MKPPFHVLWKVELRFKKYILILSFPFLSSGCELFTTRSPEKPDIGNTGFIPPTEPAIVIANFENSLKSKNIDNFINCFYTFNDKVNFIYEYIPSADAQSQFPGIFNNWRAEEERRSVTAIFNSLVDGGSIAINWLNRQPFRETADSSTYISDYILSVPNKEPSIPDYYAGRLQFNMTFRENGLWYISRWIDVNISVRDSIKNTWSMLKGYYYN